MLNLFRPMKVSVFFLLITILPMLLLTHCHAGRGRSQRKHGCGNRLVDFIRAYCFDIGGYGLASSRAKESANGRFGRHEAKSLSYCCHHECSLETLSSFCTETRIHSTTKRPSTSHALLNNPYSEVADNIPPDPPAHHQNQQRSEANEIPSNEGSLAHRIVVESTAAVNFANISDVRARYRRLLKLEKERGRSGRTSPLVDDIGRKTNSPLRNNQNYSTTPSHNDGDPAEIMWPVETANTRIQHR